MAPWPAPNDQVGESPSIALPAASFTESLKRITSPVAGVRRGRLDGERRWGGGGDLDHRGLFDAAGGRGEGGFAWAAGLHGTLALTRATDADELVHRTAS